jgi:hypothetical protein
LTLPRRGLVEETCKTFRQPISEEGLLEFQQKQIGLFSDFAP